MWWNMYFRMIRMITQHGKWIMGEGGKNPGPMTNYALVEIIPSKNNGVLSWKEHCFTKRVQQYSSSGQFFPPKKAKNIMLRGIETKWADCWDPTWYCSGTSKISVSSVLLRASPWDTNDFQQAHPCSGPGKLINLNGIAGYQQWMNEGRNEWMGELNN